MPSDFRPNSSLEQEFARKLAAQELAKYCQEFSRWRVTKRSGATLVKPQRAEGMLIPPPMKKPDPPVPRSSP